MSEKGFIATHVQNSSSIHSSHVQASVVLRHAGTECVPGGSNGDQENV